QYSGPLAFQRYFLDTVAEWELRNGRSVRVMLTTSKETTASILTDPVRSRQIAVVDMRHWQYEPDGALAAPVAGQNIAFRQLIGGDNPPATTPEQAYRQVREYRDRYPGVAWVAWHNGVGPVPAMMAGAAQILMRNPNAGHGQGRSVDRTLLDVFVREYLAPILMTMSPRDGLTGDGWVLADEALTSILIDAREGDTITLAQPLPAATYRGTWFDPESGL